MPDTPSNPPRKTPPPATPGAALKALPHSADAEEYLLSCCILDGGDVIARCLSDNISERSFYTHGNRVIFNRLCKLHENKSVPIDSTVLIEELKARDELDAAGGLPYVLQVAGKTPTTSRVGYFIERVRELELLRALIEATTKATLACYDFNWKDSSKNDVAIAEFIDEVERDIFKITQNRVAEGARRMGENPGPVTDAMKVVEKLLKKEGELTGVSSGFDDIDKLTYGFQRQEMIILAARPSMGKTALALNFAEHAVLPKSGDPVPVLFFSLEMSASQLAMRMLCSLARVNMGRLREGKSSKDDDAKLRDAANEFLNVPLYIDESSHLTVMQLRAKARRLAARLANEGTPLGFIMVDYLQLLSPTDPRVPREQQVAEMSRGLKALAKELNIPVLVLCQVNRETEKSGEGTPKLSNLRESGSIEQDADVVLMLARSQEDKKEDERQGTKSETAGTAPDLIVAKNRNGATGKLQLTFIKHYTRFENYAHAPSS
ncbi:MAG: replicative DNA helicase [Opitutaceae bacterium]|jgi:replicative DNA helicase|nr:replicative DNA helicase [Opitutaceae bacterium]